MWQSMSKEELQKQYSPSHWVKRMHPDSSVANHVNCLTTTSEKARNEVQNEAEISYGPSDAEKLDFFVPDHLPKDAPLLVYFHGGYWQALSKQASCFMAGSLTKAGAGVVVVEYELAPKATVEMIVSQCHDALKYVLQWAANRGSSGVYLCGHSAGGHIVAMMLTYDYTELIGEKATKLLKGVIPVSGVFDVRPVVHISDNEALKLTEKSAWEVSPNKYIDTICAQTKTNNVEILVAIAEHDSPEFQRQSKEFVELLKQGGVPAKFTEVPNVDHFNVIELLSDEDFLLTKEVIKIMKLPK